MVDSLASLVRGEMRKGSADTTTLVAAANLLTELRKRVQDGDALLARADTVGAEKEYAEALALVPEVDRTATCRTGSGASWKRRRKPPWPRRRPRHRKRPTRLAGRRWAGPWPQPRRPSRRGTTPRPCSATPPP